MRNPVEIDFLGSKALTGIEVDAEGSEVAPRGVDERRLLIGLDLISKRTPLHWNLHYGKLES